MEIKQNLLPKDIPPEDPGSDGNILMRTNKNSRQKSTTKNDATLGLQLLLLKSLLKL